MDNVYYIGGSPCSGKSTVAQMLAEKYDLQYYKQDDFLEEYMSKGVKESNSLFEKVASLSKDEMWLRSPALLCEEEISLYEVMFHYSMNTISTLSKGRPIIAEGAGFMPRFMKGSGISRCSYCCMVPTKDFQIEMYSKREWVSDFLADCTDSKAGFVNWMERDTLFGETVKGEAKELGYKCIIVDGKEGIHEIFTRVENHFKKGKL